MQIGKLSTWSSRPNYLLLTATLLLGAWLLDACAVSRNTTDNGEILRLIETTGFTAHVPKTRAANSSINSIDYVVSKKFQADNIHYTAYLGLFYSKPAAIPAGAQLIDCTSFELNDCAGKDSIESNLDTELEKNLLTLLRKLMSTPATHAIKEADQIAFVVHMNAKTLKATPVFKNSSAINASIQYKKVVSQAPHIVLQIVFNLKENRNLDRNWATLSDADLKAFIVEKDDYWNQYKATQS